MKLAIHRRAEIAYRSLSKQDQARVSKSIAQLEHYAPGELAAQRRVHKLVGTAAGLYSYTATTRLRLIFSIKESLCTIEYIVDHDHLNRILGRGDAS